MVHDNERLLPVNPFPELPTQASFVSGEPHGDRLRVDYFRREEDDVVVARVWFGPGSEGPPGYAHGGSVAAVLDEAMGAAAWLRGHTAVAARLVVDFRRMVEVATDARAEAWVVKHEGRKVTTRAKLLDAAGMLLAEAEGLFVELDAEGLRQVTRRPD